MDRWQKIPFFFLLMSALHVSPLYAQEKIYVFAAASTTNVVQALISAFQKDTAVDSEILTSFASSSTLARQIDSGAQADIYISANRKWMDWLKEKNLIEPGSERIMAHNALVVIASPKKQAIEKLDAIDELPVLIGSGYLAMGNHSHVPAGMYAKEALEKSGLWEKVNRKLALYPSVRIALNAVDTAQADFGIVYKTDAMRSKQSHQIYTFPAATHTPIAYPIAAIRGKKTLAAQEFLNFLRSAKSKDILQHYGFVTE